MHCEPSSTSSSYLASHCCWEVHISLLPSFSKSQAENTLTRQAKQAEGTESKKGEGRVGDGSSPWGWWCRVTPAPRRQPRSTWPSPWRKPWPAPPPAAADGAEGQPRQTARLIWWRPRASKRRRRSPRAAPGRRRSGAWWETRRRRRGGEIATGGSTRRRRDLLFFFWDYYLSKRVFASPARKKKKRHEHEITWPKRQGG